MRKGVDRQLLSFFMPDRHRKLLWVLLEDKPYRGGSSAAYFKPIAQKFWLT